MMREKEKYFLLYKLTPTLLHLLRQKKKKKKNWLKTSNRRLFLDRQ